MIDSAKTKNTIFNQSNSSSKKQHISVNDNKKIEDFFSPKIRNSNSNPNSNCNTNDSSLNEKESFLDVKPNIIEHTFVNKKRLEPLLDKNANIKEKNIKEKHPKIIEKKNNNTCSICKDGGELIMCDKCPRSFHIECLKLDESELPEGKWFCPKCVLNKQQSHMNVKIHKKLKLHSPQHNIKDIKQNNNNVNSFQNLNINLGESFPIKDKDLYANSDKYSLSKEQINKFKGNILFDNITIPSSYQHKIIMIYDYLYSFASYLQFNTDFTLNQLYLCFCNKDSQIYNSILIAFAYLFVSNIQSQTFSDLLSEDNMFQDDNISKFNINDIYTLYKVIADNANIKLFTNDAFQLILYHVLCNQNENDLAIKILDNNLNNPCDKIDIIEKLIYFSYDTDYFRDVIKKCLEKRNEIKKKLKDAEEEFKPLENKRKELERQEQFTQPKLKLENIEIAICEIYKVDSTESRSEKAKKRKQYEKEKEKYLNEIKELEKLNVKISEHKKKINAIKQELNQINSITSNSNSKCIGTDVNGSKYMYFFWDINRIFIKANDGYYYNVLCTMENISKLKASLSVKGIKEKQLLQKIDKLFTSSNLILEHISTNEEDIVDNNNMVMDIEYIQNIPSLVSLLNRLHVVENNFSTYLQKQNNQIWESESIKKQLKNWVNKQGNINNVRGIISYIELLVTNLIRPYENIDNNNKVIIIDDDDDEENEEQLIQDLAQYISHNENGDTLNKFKNPMLTFSKLRSSLFTKDYENNGIDHIYRSYLSNLSNITNHNHLYLELQVSILFLEALYNCTLLDKGNKNNQTNNILHSLDEYEYKAKKKSYWNDHCMICGEYGNVICCEKCPNVIHLFCSGISRMPDKWYCDECNSSMKYKRITRSKGICVYD